jgi:hypothetical protein
LLFKQWRQNYQQGALVVLPYTKVVRKYRCCGKQQGNFTKATGQHFFVCKDGDLIDKAIQKKR